MDLKVEGLDYSVLKEALHQAKAGRLHILDEINKTLQYPEQNEASYSKIFHYDDS